MPHLDKEQIFDTFKYQNLLVHIGAELTEISQGFAEIQLPFREELAQHNGFFHAGIITAIADTAGGYAGYTLMPPVNNVMAVEFKVNFINPAKGEKLIARAEVVKCGKTLTVCKIDIFIVDKNVESLCAIMQQTIIGIPFGENNAEKS